MPPDPLPPEPAVTSRVASTCDYCNVSLECTMLGRVPAASLVAFGEWDLSRVASQQTAHHAGDAPRCLTLEGAYLLGDRGDLKRPRKTHRDEGSRGGRGSIWSGLKTTLGRKPTLITKFTRYLPNKKECVIRAIFSLKKYTNLGKILRKETHSLSQSELFTFLLEISLATKIRNRCYILKSYQ